MSKMVPSIVSCLMFGCYVGFLAGLIYQESWTTALMVLAAYMFGLLGRGLWKVASDADEQDQELM